MVYVVSKIQNAHNNLICVRNFWNFALNCEFYVVSNFSEFSELSNLSVLWFVYKLFLLKSRGKKLNVPQSSTGDLLRCNAEIHESSSNPFWIGKKKRSRHLLTGWPFHLGTVLPLYSGPGRIQRAGNFARMSWI